MRVVSFVVPVADPGGVAVDPDPEPDADATGSDDAAAVADVADIDGNTGGKGEKNRDQL